LKKKQQTFVIVGKETVCFTVEVVFKSTVSLLLVSLVVPLTTAVLLFDETVVEGVTGLLLVVPPIVYVPYM